MKARWLDLSLLKEWSAWLPLAMSLAALALVLGYALIFGTVKQEDEGTAAHLFQLLMLAQLPVVAYFAFKWLFRQPGRALPVLVLQALAGLAPLAALFWLER